MPCSALATLIARIEADPDVAYVPAVREEVALGIASGALLAGERSAALLQNSGLGNVVNALTSFNFLYRIPVLLVISWRGHDGRDAPEHLIMGAKTIELLRVLGVLHVVADDVDAGALSAWLAERAADDRPYAVLVREGMPA